MEPNETQTAETPVEGAVETPAAETPAAETAAPTPKSYTEEQVSEIVSKRVNAYNKFGKPEDLERQLAEYRQLKAAQSAPKPAEPAAPAAAETPEDKAFRQYMERMYPGLAKYSEQAKQLQGAVGYLMQERAQAVTNSNVSYLKGIAKEAGYSDKQHEVLNDMVAASIRSSPEDLDAYRRSGSQEIVKKHFELVHASLGEVAQARAAAYAKDKAKTKDLPPKMPAAGVPAVTSQKKPMDNEARLAAAFERFKKQPLPGE